MAPSAQLGVNQVPDLGDYNLFTSDAALAEAIACFGAGWHAEHLDRLGARLGLSDVMRLGELSNRHAPDLLTHDRLGNRVDTIEFHPSWHTLLGMLRQEKLHALPWMQPLPGAHVARAAAYFMHGQIEAGSLCPTTMTFASIPVLREEPALFAGLQSKLYSSAHDPRDVPIAQKDSILIGMGMTEKQGGSDVRTNTTAARPLGNGGRGMEYLLTGHKWFFSAPMCDAHLVLAQTAKGLSCFFVPRWKPDGSRNAIFIQRLKDKLGNRSNSSSEVEFHDAYGVMVGEEGRGIATIIEMANTTRLDCVIGSAALMRQAFSQAAHHARYRMAFGKHLSDQPLMRNVLCDLALESEAATWLMLKLASACDAEDDPVQRAWRRIVTPAAKFWICKRAIEFTAECMEIWGGNGYVEDGPMARLYREAPVNSIWEGSGNVMCLDMLRAIERDREGLERIMAELEESASAHSMLRQQVSLLRKEFSASAAKCEPHARRLAQNMIVAIQANLLLRHAPSAVAEAFIASRIDAASGRVFGTMPGPSVQQVLLDRAWPH
jgi:putative acyl-CoA dehydrogenase